MNNHVIILFFSIEEIRVPVIISNCNSREHGCLIAIACPSDVRNPLGTHGSHSPHC